MANPRTQKMILGPSVLNMEEPVLFFCVHVSAINVEWRSWSVTASLVTCKTCVGATYTNTNSVVSVAIVWDISV